jgi:CxxC motif-containing protein
MEVTLSGQHVTTNGNKCIKGLEFAEEEMLDPKRNLATSVPIAGQHFQMLSVRLSQRVSRQLLFLILQEIARLRPIPPVTCGTVLIKNVLGSGADVIATRSVR